MQRKVFNLDVPLKGKYEEREKIVVFRDDYLGNEFKITLWDVDEYGRLSVYSMQPTYKARVTFVKSDNTTVVQDSGDADGGDITIANNVITIILRQNSIAALGMVRMDVQVYENEPIITSVPVRFRVDKSLLNDESVESFSEFPKLSVALNNTQNLSNQIEQAEANRGIAYTNAEQARDNSYANTEQARNVLYGTAEQNRDVLYDTAEMARHTAYDARVTAVENDLSEHKLDYATYLASELGSEHIVRILPNGTKDEIRVSEGKTIIRIGKSILNGSGDWSVFVSINNDTSYRMQLPNGHLNAYRGTIEIGYIIGWNNLHQYTSGVYSLASGLPYKIAIDTGGLLFITIDKAYLDSNFAGTLQGFKNYLIANPVTLIYQLATPVDVPLPTNMTPNTLEIARLSELVNQKADKVQEAWITPTLINGWTAVNGTPQFYKDGFDTVSFRGATSGVNSSGTMAFILPVGYRPNSSIYFSDIKGISFIVVVNHGAVIIENGKGWAALSQISFRAEV